MESQEDKNKIGKFKDSALQLTAYQVFKLNQLAENELKTITDNFIELDYEDFLNNPDAKIENICEFCNLSYSQEIKNFLIDNPLVNRNKENHEYFSQEELNLIAESNL